MACWHACGWAGRERIKTAHPSATRLVVCRSATSNDQPTGATTSGRALPFPPHAGAWVCFPASDQTSWQDQFVEFYPRDTLLSRLDGCSRPHFTPVEGGPASGADSHLNLVMAATAQQIEKACAVLGKPHGWRWAGLMDVWLEKNLMIELVPSLE